MYWANHPPKNYQLLKGGEEHKLNQINNKNNKKQGFCVRDSILWWHGCVSFDPKWWSVSENPTVLWVGFNRLETKTSFFLGSLTLGRGWQIDYTASLDGKSSDEAKLKHHLQEKTHERLSWRLCSACSWVGSVGVKLIHANSLKARRKRTVMQPYRQNAEPASHAEFPVLSKIVESFCLNSCGSSALI